MQGRKRGTPLKKFELRVRLRLFYRCQPPLPDPSHFGVGKFSDKLEAHFPEGGVGGIALCCRLRKQSPVSGSAVRVILINSETIMPVATPWSSQTA